VQLFDGDASRARAVADFIRDGLLTGERVVVVMRLDKWTGTAAALGPDIGLREAIASGRLTVLDAHDTLERLLRDGTPDAERFNDVIGSLVAAEVPGTRGLRAYGEMVDVLAADGDFHGARQLEALWNDLRARIPFALFCGYSSVHFPDARGGEALRAIRRLHTHAHLDADDVLGTRLMADAGL
jgi:hypothetical protein